MSEIVSSTYVCVRMCTVRLYCLQTVFQVYIRTYVPTTYIRTYTHRHWCCTCTHVRIATQVCTHPPPTTPVPSSDHTPLQAANGFMLIISCQQARVLYVSETVEDVLHESQDAWKGQFFYDILHPKDIQKVKAQLDCMNIEESE